MENSNEQLAALRDIRSIMEKSSKFVSLSGLSGVFVGIIALIGAVVAYSFLLNDPSREYFESVYNVNGPLELDTILFIVADAFAVLILAAITGYYFTQRKAKKLGQKIFNSVGKRMFFSMIIPLFTGGLICLIMLYYGLVFMLAPLTLVFYGLALLNGSYYTLPEIKYLGISEIILGLLSFFFIGYGILFWSIGFGILHIAYGIYMHNKYDKK